MFCVKSLDLMFKILVECPTGPLIVEYENTISCNFHITSKHKESVKILNNFIKKKFKEVQVY